MRHQEVVPVRFLQSATHRGPSVREMIRATRVLRAGTEQYILRIGTAVGIKSAASWLQRVRQRTNIHRYFVLTRLYEQSAGAASRKIVCSLNPFSFIPWNSTRIITASVPANYVFAGPYGRAAITCIHASAAHIFNETLRNIDTTLLLRFSEAHDSAPAASREIVLLRTVNYRLYE